MNNNSTLAGKSIIILTILAIFSYSSVKCQDTLQAKKPYVFDAVAFNNTRIYLNWTAQAAVTNDHFEVERSFDGINFSPAAYVLGAQSESNGIEQYSFKDMDKRLPGYSVIYYRLKQVDVNGNFTYSIVKTVRKGHIGHQMATAKVISRP